MAHGVARATLLSSAAAVQLAMTRESTRQINMTMTFLQALYSDSFSLRLKTDLILSLRFQDGH